MRKASFFVIFWAMTFTALAQEVMTPELLWRLGRVSPLGIKRDESALIYRVATPEISTNANRVKTFRVSLPGGVTEEITKLDGLLNDKHVSPDGKYRISANEVKIEKVLGAEGYPDLPQSDVYIY